MEFTGERFVPTLQGDIRLEHFHRYEWCLPFVGGKRVLDIACGEGYGSRILARAAASVTGVDISDEAVAHAQQAYPGVPGLSFQQGDAAEIPLPDRCVDVVVSFETIEHHERHIEMMSEIRRVLTEDGLLIISSPNKQIYSDLAGSDHNHFHVKELYFAELDALLRQYFASVSYFGQRFTGGSLVQPLDGRAAHDGMRVYTETPDGVVLANPARIEPMYYLAMATNAPLPQLPGASVFFSDTDNAFYEKQREVLDLGGEVRRMSDYIAEVSGVLQVRDADITDCRDRIAELEAALAQSQAQLGTTLDELHTTQGMLGECRAHLNAILNSRSWRYLTKAKALLGRK